MLGLELKSNEAHAGLVNAHACRKTAFSREYILMFRVLIIFITLVAPSLVMAQQVVFPALESLKDMYANADMIAESVVAPPKSVDKN